MRGEAGQIVLTKSGKLGIVKNSSQPINNKIPVHLVDEKYQPVLDEKFNQVVLLCDPKTLTLKGFVN